MYTSDQIGETVEKEEKIVVILLLMAILSLTVAYFTLNPNSLNNKYLPTLSKDTEIGEMVTIEGVVYEKSMTGTGEHLVMTIDYDSWLINVFVPGNSGAVELGNIIQEGDRVRITGTLEEYRGEKELVVASKNDVDILQPP